MRKWHKRSLLVLGLGVVGTLLLGLRPALVPDEIVQISHFSQEIPLPEHLRDSDFSFSHAISVNAPHRGTWYANGSEDVHPLLKSAEWKINLSCRDGKLIIHSEAPQLSAEMAQIKAGWLVGLGEPCLVRRPNGDIHTEYQLHISCRMEYIPCFWQKTLREHFIQFITIDVEDAAADMGTILLADMGRDTPFASQFHPGMTGPAPILPARYCYSAKENALLRLLHTLAACTPTTHHYLSQRLTNGADQLCRFATDAPWPACWGDAADMAETIAYRVGPTLEYLAEQECFGNQQLADFINGESFAKIFGTHFRNSKSSDIGVNLRDIEIQRITPQEQQKEE